MTKPVWFPADPSSTNVGRFMAAHGIERFEDLERRSIDEPEWFWDAVVKFLDIDFPTPYRQVLDVSDGIAWARWFVGGETNFAHVAVDRHPAERTAIVWEGEDGEVRTWTYGEAARHATLVTNPARLLGPWAAAA